MSPIFRGVIIVVLILTFFVISIYQRSIRKNIYERSYIYLSFLSIFFPFLDISFGEGINLFDSASFMFLILNFDIFKRVRWKSFSLVVLFVIILLITSLFSAFSTNSLEALPNRLSGFIMFMTVIVMLSDKKKQYDSDTLVKLLRLPIFYAILWGLIQLMILPHFSIYYSAYTEDARISSCFREPQVAGCIIAIFTLYEWNKFSIKAKWIDLLFACILFLIGCYTGSKSFFIGFFIGFILIFLSNKLSASKFGFLVVIAFIIAFTENYWEQLPVFQRFVNFDESYSYRQDVFWMQGIQIFLDNWLGGIGTGNFQLYIEEKQIPLIHWHGGDNIYATQPESGYLLWLDELGIFSIIYILLLSNILKKKGNALCNVMLVTPWMISFISVYNLESRHMVFVLFMILAFIFSTSRKIKYIK